MELQFDNEEPNPIKSIVQQIIFEQNLKRKLDALDVVINGLDKQTYDNTNSKEFQVYINSLFSDRFFMRKLTYISQINDVPELCLEYTGRDYLSNQEFDYNDKFENKVSEIRKKVNVYLGALLKEFTKSTTLEL